MFFGQCLEFSVSSLIFSAYEKVSIFVGFISRMDFHWEKERRIRVVFGKRLLKSS